MGISLKGEDKSPNLILVFLILITILTITGIAISYNLQPTVKHLDVNRYITKEEFAGYKDFGIKMGFDVVESGPLVRSSYHAKDSFASV